MGRVVHPAQSRRQCKVCGKGALASRNRSHSMRKTNRTIWKNLQQTPNGLYCTQCLKSQRPTPSRT